MSASTSNHPHQTVTAVVLAGGQSSRMGTDKALLPWQGVPLLQRVCQVAVQCCPAVYVLTPWPDRYQHLVVKPCLTLTELTPGQGPLVALEQGFRQLQSTWLLLLACDLPLLNANLLQSWTQRLPNDETMAAIPYYADHWEPLCGFYHHQSHLQLKSFIDQGGRSFQNWLPTIPTRKIAVDAEAASMFWNCNSPEDLMPIET